MTTGSCQHPKTHRSHADNWDIQMRVSTEVAMVSRLNSDLQYTTETLKRWYTEIIMQFVKYRQCKGVPKFNE